MFKVGDVVEVVNTGECYSTYSVMAELMSATAWKPGNDLKLGDIATVIAKHPHEEGVRYGMLYLLQDSSGKQVIFGGDGLKVVDGFKSATLFKNSEKTHLEIDPISGVVTRFRSSVSGDNLKKVEHHCKATKTKSAIEVAKTWVDHKIVMLKRAGWVEEWETHKKVLKPMLLTDFEERYVLYPCIVQPKFNGLRATWHPEKRKLISRGLQEFNLPHIEKSLETVDRYLDGELYCHGKSLQEIKSMVSNGDTRVEFILFDVPNEVDPYITRLKILGDLESKLMEKLGILFAESFACRNYSEVESLHKKNLELGLEGSVVKNTHGMYKFDTRSKDVLKLKPTFSEEFVIRGITSDKNTKGEDLISFICEAAEGKEFKVIPSWSHEERKERFRTCYQGSDIGNSPDCEYINKLLTVEFKGLSDEGIPLHAVGITIREREDL